MGDDLLDMLTRRARSLKLARAAESAAVSGIAGCLAAAALAAAIGIRAASFPAAIALAAVPVLLGLLLAAWPTPRRRWNLSPAQAVLPAAVLIAAGALGLMALHSGPDGRGELSAAVAAVALLAGAILPLLARRDLPAAARFLDARGRFAERLATAAQLASAARSDPASQLVRRQAADILRSGQADRISPWTRTRATPAALAVAALLWALVLLLPAAAVPAPGGVGEQLAALTPEQKEQLIRQILQAASAGQTPALVHLADKLPNAVHSADAAAFARLLDELRAAGVDVDKVLASRFPSLASAAAAGAGGKTSSGSRPSPNRAGPPPSLVSSAGPPVWVAPPSLRTTTLPAVPAPLDPSASIPFDLDWRNAQDAAATALDNQTIPLRHRQLVRDFFAGDTPR